MFDVAAKPIDVDSNFVLYPAPLFLIPVSPTMFNLFVVVFLSIIFLVLVEA